jgi:hypothetical protein
MSCIGDAHLLRFIRLHCENPDHGPYWMSCLVSVKLRARQIPVCTLRKRQLHTSMWYNSYAHGVLQYNHRIVYFMQMK